MRYLIILIFNYTFFSCLIFSQNDTTVVLKNDSWKYFKVLNRKTIKDSIISPQLINECSLSETIAREILFTNQFAIDGDYWIIFKIEFTINKDGLVNTGSYKSEFKYKGIDYSFLCKDSILKELKLWRPAILIENKNKAVDYAVKVFIDFYKEKLEITILNSDFQLIEERIFPRPLVFK